MEADTDIMGMDFGRYFTGMDRDKVTDTIMVMVNTTETEENTRMKSNT
jgi:hypothetical protein